MQIVLCTDDKELDKCAALMASMAPWTKLNFSLERCRAAVRGHYKEVYVAREDGELVGFVSLFLHGLLNGYIQILCVHPSHQRRGIGTSLLKYSEARILKQSPNVFICVSSFNEEAQELYDRFGFRKIGELKDFAVEGLDEYILRKSTVPITQFLPK